MLATVSILAMAFGLTGFGRMGLIQRKPTSGGGGGGGGNANSVYPYLLF